MSVETDSPDPGGRNPYQGEDHQNEQPPKAANGNGDHTEVEAPPAPSEPAGPPAPPDPPPGPRANGDHQPAAAPVVAPEQIPPPPDTAPTMPFIDLRVDGSPPPAADAAAGLPAPLVRRGPGPRRQRRRSGADAEARTEGRWVVHRLRNVSAWSVFKVVVLFYFCVFLMFMVAGVLLWKIGRQTETVDQIEGLVTRLGAYGECVPKAEVPVGTDFESDDDCPDGEVIVDGFKFDDGTLFRSALFSGIIFVIAGTALTVMLTVLLNLLNDVTGGVRYATVREANPPPSRSPVP